MTVPNIGTKIRELRVSKLMTQSELAGTQITRNMLSCIENGTAQPSLSTILYIAERLKVPVGFLLAEEGDELLYRKMNNFANIKRAYIAGDWWGCRNLCLSACPEPDDELKLLLAECDANIAEDSFWQGKLHSACRFFDEALEYADGTFYPTEHIEAKARVFFSYLQKISPTFYSDMLNEEKEITLISTSPFAAYFDAVEALEEGNLKPLEAFLSAPCGDAFFAAHLRILLLMQNNEYARAKDELLSLLRADEPLKPISLYSVLGNLEICCRETEDYKGAYNFSGERVQLLEQLLKET